LLWSAVASPHPKAQDYADFQSGITAGICVRRNGVQGFFAWQQFFETDVRFGSKADIEARPGNVRFTPESGHSSSHEGRPFRALQAW
jgi:hypothetical protein